MCQEWLSDYVFNLSLIFENLNSYTHANGSHMEQHSPGPSKETLWDRQAHQAKLNEKFQILKTHCRP